MTKAWEIEKFLEVKNNQLHIDGISAIELAEKHETPLFVFSESRIRHNINRLQRSEDFIDCKLKLCYAAKANSNHQILKAIRRAGSDLEVNSGGELKMALDAGFSGDQIIFNGSAKTEEEIEDAINAEIYAIQADSFYEVELIEKVARSINKRANVSLRLVPEIESETLHGLQTALLTSKFGMMPEEALEAFKRWPADDKYLNLCGIHIHIGSQNPKSEPYSDAFLTLFENLLTIFNETGHKLSHLNLGGGFPVNYLRDDSNVKNISPEQKALFSADLDPAEVLRNAWQKVKSTAQKANAGHLLENIELLIEPGRSVIADAGICLTKVRNFKKRPVRKLTVSSEQLADEKNSEPETLNSEPETLNPLLSEDHWLLTDAGFNILLSMETYKWYYHLISTERAGEPHHTPYKLAGPLCDGGDVYFDIEGKNRLPDYRLLPENVEVGEILALLNCGAYSVAQMFPYNGRELPEVILLES
jgi:diaminopimelate decarboxylase